MDFWNLICVSSPLTFARARRRSNSRRQTREGLGISVLASSPLCCPRAREGDTRSGQEISACVSPSLPARARERHRRREFLSAGVSPLVSLGPARARRVEREERKTRGRDRRNHRSSIHGLFFKVMLRSGSSSLLSRFLARARGDNKRSHQTLILESHACWWLHLVSPPLFVVVSPQRARGNRGVTRRDVCRRS